MRKILLLLVLLFFISSCAKNGGVCEEISSAEEKDKCYFNLAKEKKDVSECEKIIDKNEKDYCYSIIASRVKDHRLCEKIINNDEQKDSCYIGIAFATKDAEYCKKVLDLKQVRNCNDTVKRLSESQISKLLAHPRWLISNALYIVIYIFLSALLLRFLTKRFMVENQSYKTALVISGVTGLIIFCGSVFEAISERTYLTAWNYIPEITVLYLVFYVFYGGAGALLRIGGFSILSNILGILLIKQAYKIGWKRTLLIWLLWFLSTLFLRYLLLIIFQYGRLFLAVLNPIF